MPIEELLAMYYGNSTEASEVAPQENATYNSPKSEGINTTSNPLNNDTQDENKDNEIDPFFNQRITRGCKFEVLILGYLMSKRYSPKRCFYCRLCLSLKLFLCLP